MTDQIKAKYGFAKRARVLPGLPAFGAASASIRFELQSG